MIVLKILLFLAINLIGFFTNAFLVNIGIMFGVYPLMPSQASLDLFNAWLYTGAFWVWVAAALLSVGYFIAEKNQNWFILAPIYSPLIYSMAVMTYFTYAPLAG